MKNRKRIFLCVFVILTVLFLFALVEKEEDVTGKTLVQSDTTMTDSQYHYYMKKLNGSVIVYNKDHTVYEYTDLIPEFLPEEVVQKLNLGIYFQNQEELYEFLETYSS